MSERSTDPPNIDTQKIRVGDIDIAYRTFGHGDPLLLIPGTSMTMDVWDPYILNKLSGNHTIIVFDNRGIGQTTAGNKVWSRKQFANDTAGLLDALKIKQPADMLGFSLGGIIAQELALSHPAKVKRLILIASSCGGKEALPPQLNPEQLQSMISGNASQELFLHSLFPQDWIQNNSEYIENEFVSPFGNVSKESLQLQAAATSMWSGSCNRLSEMSNPTLVVTGTQDIFSPPANSVMMAEKIPGAWLVQIEGGGGMA